MYIYIYIYFFLISVGSGLRFLRWGISGSRNMSNLLVYILFYFIFYFKQHITCSGGEEGFGQSDKEQGREKRRGKED